MSVIDQFTYHSLEFLDSTSTAGSGSKEEPESDSARASASASASASTSGEPSMAEYIEHMRQAPLTSNIRVVTHRMSRSVHDIPVSEFFGSRITAEPTPEAYPFPSSSSRSPSLASLGEEREDLDGAVGVGASGCPAFSEGNSLVEPNRYHLYSALAQMRSSGSVDYFNSPLLVGWGLDELELELTTLLPALKKAGGVLTVRDGKVYVGGIAVEMGPAATMATGLFCAICFGWLLGPRMKKE